MQFILDYTEKELKEQFANCGVKGFRVEQVLRALYDGKTFEEINNIPQNEKDIIKEHFLFDAVSVAFKQQSVDGTIKYALKLFDGNVIEAVVMKYSYGNTLCLSTQVGCNMGCKFCASSLGGKVRDLSCAEMLGQVQKINCELGGNLKDRAITNIVLMGCGEPLDNFENVCAFIERVNDEKYLNISQRNISLSTCGLVDKIYDLAERDYGINLTVSLHASNDKDRRQIMPIAKAYTIQEVLKATDYYFKKTGRRIYFEYTLCSGINDKEQNAIELAELLRKRVCHVNVIKLNEVLERNIKGVSRAKAQEFVKSLNDKGVSATLRRTLGEDIDGACGQLRRRVMEEL